MPVALAQGEVSQWPNGHRSGRALTGWEQISSSHSQFEIRPLAPHIARYASVAELVDAGD